MAAAGRTRLNPLRRRMRGADQKPPRGRADATSRARVAAVHERDFECPESAGPLAGTPGDSGPTHRSLLALCTQSFRFITVRYVYDGPGQGWSATQVAVGRRSCARVPGARAR